MSQPRRSVSKRARDTEQPAVDTNAKTIAPLKNLLPQNVEKADKVVRAKALNKNREAYQWQPNNGWMPQGIQAVPAQEKTLDVYAQVFKMFGPGAMINTKQMKAKKLFLSVYESLGGKDEEPFEKYAQLYPSAVEGLCKVETPVPTIAKDNLWTTDQEFGRQKVSGINPLMIRKCPPLKELRKKFPVTEADMKGVLPEGTTLANLEKQGNKLWIVDYINLDGIQDIAKPPPTGPAWFYVPIVLFWTDENDDMMPLAIQLQQDPKKGPVYTPNDDAGLWLLAKSAVNQTEISYLISCDHINNHHLVFETFYVAAMRTIAPQHPIHQVLHDSFWMTLTVNFGIKTKLMNKTGQLSTLFSQGHEGLKEMVKRDTYGVNGEGCDFNRYVFAENIKERGVENLPKFWWRDDLADGWNCWTEFATNLVNNLYSTDDDVYNDYEIQNWATEFTSCTNWKNLPLTNGSFYTKAQLIHFLNTLLFSVTFRHCSVHMTQWDLISFAPNAPASLRAEVPTDKNVRITHEELFNTYLPDLDKLIIQVSFFTGVTFQPVDGYKVGQFTDQFLPLNGEAGAGAHYLGQAMMEGLQGKLKVMSERINLRNANLTIPYNYLNPEVVWRSICM